ncbi:UNVERIFIED_CONTAM: hypothetical protein K2H54_039957 [Gekko kuhli]
MLYMHKIPEQEEVFWWDMILEVSEVCFGHVIYFAESRASREGTASCDSEKAGDQYRLLDLEPVRNDETSEQDKPPEKADSKATVPEIQSSTTQKEEASENEKTGGVDSSVTAHKNPGPDLQNSS